MLIVSTDQIVKIKGVLYCKPYAYTSLSQYWEPFENVKILGYETILNAVPSGWKEIPSRMSFYPINNIDTNNPMLKSKIKSNIYKFISNEDLAYIRMPDFRVYEVYKMIKDTIPLFCEFHGDWEEAILLQKLNSIGFKNKIKATISHIRARKVHQIYQDIASVGVVNIAIGPRLAEKYNLYQKPTLVTANHIIKESEIIVNECPNNNEGILKLLFVGELQHRKGLDYLIDAVDEIAREGKIKLSLMIIGDGYLRNQLEQKVKDKHLENIIEFSGAIYNRSILDDIYQNADIFVLPSIGGEGVPRVLQEAQAFGCAIVATDIGSTYWQLENNAGVLVPPGETQSLKEGILKLNDNNFRCEVVKNGYAKAVEFSYEKQKNNIQSFLTLHLSEHMK